MSPLPTLPEFQRFPNSHKKAGAKRPGFFNQFFNLAYLPMT